jgi:hypothetical protein
MKQTRKFKKSNHHRQAAASMVGQPEGGSALGGNQDQYQQLGQFLDRVPDNLDDPAINWT